MLINIDHIADLTGSTRRTILKRLQDLPRKAGTGRSILYESRDALPVMYGVGVPKTGKKTLESERTRLASAQAEKTELEVDVIKGSLIPSSHVKLVVDTMVSAFRAKMLSLPSKAAHAVIPLADHAAAEEVLREYVHEALQELSDYDSEKYCTSDDNQMRETSSATPHSDGKSVGRPKKKAVKGSKRRTGPVEH